jgi:ketosteroid isomerase-like protein
MKLQIVYQLALAAALTASAAPSKLDREKAAVEKTAFTFVGWALENKNLEGLKASVSQGEDFFMFMPDSKTTTDGYQAFTKLFPAWMSADFKATRTELRDVKIHVASSGKVAWFSSILEDCGEYKGRASCWKDCRYTGVAEKRSGRWVIVQAHFSFAYDKVIEGYKKRLAGQPAGDKKP